MDKPAPYTLAPLSIYKLRYIQYTSSMNDVTK